MSFITANYANVISKRDYHEIYVLMSFRHESRAKIMNYKL